MTRGDEEDEKRRDMRKSERTMDEKGNISSLRMHIILKNPEIVGIYPVR
jgi:hypothetical protein